MGGSNHRTLYTCMKLSTKLISNEVTSLIPKAETTKWWLSQNSQDSLSFILFASIHVLPVHTGPLSVLRNSMRHHYCTQQDRSGAHARIHAVHQLHQTAYLCFHTAALRPILHISLLRQHISVLPGQVLNWRCSGLGLLSAVIIGTCTIPSSQYFPYLVLKWTLYTCHCLNKSTQCLSYTSGLNSNLLVLFKGQFEMNSDPALQQPCLLLLPFLTEESVVVSHWCQPDWTRGGPS